MRKRTKQFDPSASLNELISGMEQITGTRTAGEPSAACEAILSQVREAFGEFERGVISLYESGQTAAVEIIVGDMARCMRRAIRLAGEYGGTTTAIDSPVLE
jgi:hypothetical protein